MDVEWTGKRLSVLLAGLVAVLSIATGIVNIAYGDVSLIRPLQPFVPRWVRTAAGFTGALTGFTMLLGVFGLRGGYRAGWYLTILLLPVTAAQGLVQSSPMSIPLIALSVLALPTLVLSRGLFDRPIDLSLSQIAAGISLAGVLLYGTVGTYALREEFNQVSTVLDAFYFTLVTASTVGYGDVTGASQVGRLFAMTVVVFGTASFAVALGALLGPVIEAQLAAALGKARSEDLELLENHVVVMGYGDLTEPVVAELQGRCEFVVVTPDDGQVAQLDNRDVLVLDADPEDEAALERVNVDEATVAIAATNNDAEDAFAVLTARQLAPDLRIVAAATSKENVSKLRRAGADVVVSPATIGGRMLVGAASSAGSEPSVAGATSDAVQAESGVAEGAVATDSDGGRG